MHATINNGRPAQTLTRVGYSYAATLAPAPYCALDDHALAIAHNEIARCIQLARGGTMSVPIEQADRWLRLIEMAALGVVPPAARA